MVKPKRQGAPLKGEKKEVERNEEVEMNVSKEVKKEENNTLIWFFVIVVVVFGAVLVPYFWSESSKVFEFGGVDWVIEEYDYLEIFHGRFVSLTNPNLHYNVFFRTDPRTNDAEVSGKLDDFWNHEAISLSQSVDACRGDLSRVMLDLGAFLKQGVGAGVVESGSTNEEVANGSSRKFLTCEDAVDKTVIVVDISPRDDSGEPGERGIVQDEVNPSCYTIYAEDCEDSGVVEKFILQSVVDFRDSYPLEKVEE